MTDYFISVLIFAASLVSINPFREPEDVYSRYLASPFRNGNIVLQMYSQLDVKYVRL